MSSCDEYARCFGVELPKYAEYKIFTKWGDWYVINNKGQVLEARNSFNARGMSEQELNKWLIDGAWYSGSYGRTYCITLETLLKETKFLYKNGKPIYGICDIDHGTPRMHGNKEVHGIIGIQRMI